MTGQKIKNSHNLPCYMVILPHFLKRKIIKDNGSNKNNN